MKNAILVLNLLFLTTLLTAQVRLKPEVIALAEKLKKQYPKESYVSLNSTVEYNFRIARDGESVQCTELVKEKIMSLEEDKTFYKTVFFNEESKIVDVRVSSYRGAKKSIIANTAKYKTDGIFYDDASIAFFSFDLKTRGDNSEYSYTKRYKDVKYVTKEFFHNSFPKLEATIIFNVPDWLHLEFVEENFDGYDVVKTEKYNGKRKFKTITYKLKNLEPIKGGSYAISAVQELPHLLILSKSYKRRGETINLFNSTQDLYDWYASLLKLMENDSEVFKDKVDELVADAKTDEEKVKNIFYWVQDNTRYIAYEDGIMGFKPANANDVFEKRFGDCKGMANLTCSMLKQAGFDARLTWIGTKSIPYTYATPSLAVDNHMITTLFLNDKRYFLDATEKGVALDEYAYRIQGQDVLIEDGENYILDTVPEFDDSYNVKKTSYNLILKDGIISGDALEEYHGEERIRLYRNLGNVSKVDLFERVGKFVANYDKNNTVTDLHISNYSNRSKPISFEYKVSIKNKITELENERYLNLDLDENYSSLKTEEGRNLGYDFHQKVHNNYEVNLKIPDNYSVDYLPDSLNIDNDEFTFHVVYSFDEASRKVNYTKTIIIKNGIITPSKFDEWNKAVKKLKEIYGDQIVLIVK